MVWANKNEGAAPAEMPEAAGPSEQAEMVEVGSEGSAPEKNTSEQIIDGWKEEIAKIEAAINKGEVRELGFADNGEAEKRILELEDKIRGQESNWRHRAQIIELPQKPAEGEPVAPTPEQPKDDTPIPTIRAAAVAAAERANIDFNKAWNLESLYEMIREAGPITTSNNKTFTPEEVIEFIKQGRTEYVTNKDGLRDRAKKLIEKETYFTTANSLDDLYEMIRDYYRRAGVIRSSDGKAYSDPEKLIEQIKHGWWQTVTGQMGLRETAMRLRDQQIRGEGTERKKPGFFRRLFGRN